MQQVATHHERVESGTEPLVSEEGPSAAPAKPSMLEQQQVCKP